MKPYHYFLLALFSAAWIWSAVNPVHREIWFMENKLVLIFVPIILLAGWKYRLTNLSYTLSTVFIILHLVGAHYTYGHVPGMEWLSEFFGTERNVFDRIVHFSFGFLMAYPIREIFLKVAEVRGFWSYYLPFDVVLSFSAVYEIAEWIAIFNRPPEFAALFLGSGDNWDAQKDMLLAGIGAALAMGIIAAINWTHGRDIWTEISQSLRFRRKTVVPPGDEAVHTLAA